MLRYVVRTESRQLNREKLVTGGLVQVQLLLRVLKLRRISHLSRNILEYLFSLYVCLLMKASHFAINPALKCAIDVGGAYVFSYWGA